MTDADWLAARFEEHRPHLRSVAYRMLGLAGRGGGHRPGRLAPGESSRCRRGREPGRLSNDRGGSAWSAAFAHRREGVQCPARPICPASRRRGFGGASLERLTVLAQFDRFWRCSSSSTDCRPQAPFVRSTTRSRLPFDEIAPIVDRTPTATRQLASRARRRVRGAGPTSSSVPLARQHPGSSMPSSPHHEPATSRRAPAHPRPQRRRPRRRGRRSGPVRGSDRGAWGGRRSRRRRPHSGGSPRAPATATVNRGAGAVVPFGRSPLRRRGTPRSAGTRSSRWTSSSGPIGSASWVSASADRPAAHPRHAVDQPRCGSSRPRSYAVATAAARSRSFS